MEYFTFPMETLNVTQRYDGTASHLPHTTGNPKDYPIDLAGIDGNQSAIFARVPLKVIAKRGIGNASVTNTVWLQTTEPVITPTFTDYVWMTLTHWNDGDIQLKKYNEGDIIPEGAIICYEGRDGATANHIHLTCGRGYSDNWTQNSNGKWVMTGDSKKPEEVMFIDHDFTTTIKNSGNLGWQDLPKPEPTPVPTQPDTSEIDSLKKQISELQTKIKEDDSTILSLNAKIEELNKNQEKHNLKSYKASEDLKCYIRLKKDEVIEYEVR